MNAAIRTGLVAWAWWHLLRFDVECLVRGTPELRQPSPRRQLTTNSDAWRTAIVEAFELAACFYVHEVRCLQRAICLVRMLRAIGLPARLVIGYRMRPFCSHAWTELDGVVVSESATYKNRLGVLFTS